MPEHNARAADYLLRELNRSSEDEGLSYLSEDENGLGWSLEESDAPTSRSEVRRSSDRDFYPSLPLGLQRTELRILTIQPATDLIEGVVCTLAICSLESNPQYEALSYTWGTRSGAHSIYVNGYRYSVRDNLFAALRRLRRPNLPRKLWVDAICVNQRDVNERGHQVGLMGRIYRQARQVLIWLGDVDDSQLAGRKSCFDERSIDIARCQKGILDSLSIVLVRTRPPWWERAWVVQEFVMSSKAPIVLFCAYELAVDDVAALLIAHKRLCINTTCQALEKSVRFLSRINALMRIRNSYRAAGVSMLGITLATIGTHATDRRDKVFSLLGMVTGAESSLVSPDYNMPLTEVFERATYACAAGSRTLRHLNLVRVGTKRNDAYPALASWAFDFTDTAKWYVQHTDLTPLKQEEARPRNLIHTLRPAGSTLTVSGRRLGRVDVVLPVAGEEIPDQKRDGQPRKRKAASVNIGIRVGANVLPDLSRDDDMKEQPAPRKKGASRMDMQTWALQMNIKAYEFSRPADPRHTVSEGSFSRNLTPADVKNEMNEVMSLRRHDLGQLSLEQLRDISDFTNAVRLKRLTSTVSERVLRIPELWQIYRLASLPSTTGPWQCWVRNRCVFQNWVEYFKHTSDHVVSFSTEYRFLGFGSGLVRPEDELFLLDGADAPVILRPNLRGGHQFRGLACVAGVDPKVYGNQDWQSVTLV